MKPSRLNLCQEVREALIAEGYSTVKVVNAVNAELGKATLKSTSDPKTGSGKIRKDTYTVTVSGSFKWTNPATIPCVFDTWHSAMEKAQKVAPCEIGIPVVFREWLDGFAKNTVESEKTSESNSPPNTEPQK